MNKIEELEKRLEKVEVQMSALIVTLKKYFKNK